MTGRQKKIWELLTEWDYLTAKQIGERLHLSDRTVRTEIKEINAGKKREVIGAKKGRGYFILDGGAFRHELSEGPESGENVEWEVVRRVLFEEEAPYLELADELYISDALLTKIIVQVNRRMQRCYGKGIIRKQGGCLVLELTEQEKREYYGIYITSRNVGQYFQPESFQPYFDWIDIQEIRRMIVDCVHRHSTPLFDATIMRLILGTAVMAERMAAGFFVDAECQDGAEGYVTDETDVAEVMEELGGMLSLTVPEAEFGYCRGLFRNDFYLIEGMEEGLAESLLQKILIEIQVEYGYDFSGDEEFCREMKAQLIGTWKRKQNQQLAVNPVLHHIKAQYPLEYDIAIFLADRFNRLAGCSVEEEEVGLFAIHIIRAMEADLMRMEKTVALVNPFGKQVKELIRKRLEEMGECRLKIGPVYSVFDLPEYFPKDLLAVLTTVPLASMPEDIPVVLCRNFLDYHEREKLLEIIRDEQVSSVREYFKKLFRPSLFFPEVDLESKQEVLGFQCRQLLNQGYVEEGFLESVLQREDIAPTAFEAGFAIAHGMENSAKRTAVCVCILKNKIPWGEYNVKIVFLFALASDWNHAMIPVYNVMLDNLMKTGGVRRLSRAQSFREFAGLLL